MQYNAMRDNLATRPRDHNLRTILPIIHPTLPSAQLQYPVGQSFNFASLRRASPEFFSDAAAFLDLPNLPTVIRHGLVDFSSDGEVEACGSYRSIIIDSRNRPPTRSSGPLPRQEARQLPPRYCVGYDNAFEPSDYYDDNYIIDHENRHQLARSCLPYRRCCLHISPVQLDS